MSDQPKHDDVAAQVAYEQEVAQRETKSHLLNQQLEHREALYGGGFARFDANAKRLDRQSDLQQQQQQTRDWVGDMVKRMEEIEREQPKARRQERGEERER